MDFGILHLSTQQPSAVQATAWTDWPVHSWMLIGSALLILLFLPEIYKLFPAMMGCLTRSRGNLEVEHSISTARSRSNVARMLVLIFIVVADRYRLYNPSFIAPWSECWLRFAQLAGVLAAYWLLRAILGKLLFSLSRRRMHQEEELAVRRGMYNYFICFMLLALVSICILCIFRADDGVIRQVIWGELALLWLVAFVREAQILQSIHSGFITFLYLCGLEIIPAGIIIVSGLIY